MSLNHTVGKERLTKICLLSFFLLLFFCLFWHNLNKQNDSGILISSLFSGKSIQHQPPIHWAHSIYIRYNWHVYERSLTRVSVVRMKKFCTLSYPKCAQSKIWSDCANAQADQNLRWAHMSEGTFSEVVTRILRSSYKGFVLCRLHLSSHGFVLLLVSNDGARLFW